ncbi:MAG: type II toxin-antitoxin system HicB family antitoxin [Bacteroidia bacterium]
MKLEVIIEKDETGYYIAEVPALPGCLSQGKTAAEAEKNIKEAIEGWLDVMSEKAHQAIMRRAKKHIFKRIAVTI